VFITIGSSHDSLEEIK